MGELQEKANRNLENKRIDRIIGKGKPEFYRIIIRVEILGERDYFVCLYRNPFMAIEKGRIESLDSLRGIAALTVVFSHLNLEYLHLNTEAPFINKSFLHIFYDGEAAVVFFFVLSGFVLSFKYFADDRFQKLSYGPYLISRIFRIYPVLWIVMILTVILGLNLPHSLQTIPMRAWTTYWWGDKFDFLSLLRQMSLVSNDPIAGNNYIPQAWTLKIEIILSAFVPILIVIARHRTSWLIIFNIFLLTFFDIYGFIIHFSMGVLLAKYLPDINKHFSVKGGIYKLSLFFIGILLYSYRYSVAVFFSHKGFWGNFLFGDFGTGIAFIIGLGVLLIIISVFNSVRLTRILNKSMMLLMGRISYSLYLSHLIVLVMLTPSFILGLNKIGVTSSLIILPLTIAFTIICAVGLAYILYNYVEVWSIKSGRIVSTWWQTRFD
jgi:peptidoglycan/LPS O-acetylase OafA/YrhL